MIPALHAKLLVGRGLQAIDGLWIEMLLIAGGRRAICFIFRS